MRGIIAEIEEVCRKSDVPIREGVVVGASPALGLHAYQQEVVQTNASIIDVAVPFIVFCNQVAILLARTLEHRRDGDGYAVVCDPAAAADLLSGDRQIFNAWAPP